MSFPPSLSANLPNHEDIVTISRVEGLYTIWSLADISPSNETAPDTLPVELKTISTDHLPQALLNEHLLEDLPAYLRPSETEIHLVISTGSGTRLAFSFFDKVLHPLLDAIGLKESDYEIHRTTDDQSVRKFAESQLWNTAQDGRHQVVLLLSGDGAIVDIINGIAQSGERSK